MQVGIDVAARGKSGSNQRMKMQKLLVEKGYVAFRGLRGSHLCHLNCHVFENPIFSALVRLHHLLPQGLRFE